MKAAIVTGANGFVGSAVTKELLSNGYRVYLWTWRGAARTLPAHTECIFIPCELSDMAALEHKMPCGEADIMYHFAWAGSAGPMRADTRVQLDNAQWTVDSLRVAKRLGCRRFICAGSIMEHETHGRCLYAGEQAGVGLYLRQWQAGSAHHVHECRGRYRD